MNTVDGLKKLPSIINNLLDQRDAIQEQIDACYKPFREIIREVFLDRMGWVYVDDIDIGVGDTNVCFALRYHSDDECEGTYKYPIEAFVSADALRKYIEYQKITERVKKNWTPTTPEERACTNLDDKEIDKPLHEKLGMDERDLHYRGT